MDQDSVWDMLTKLAREGGCIVASADCDVIEIAFARARGDFLVDNRGYGWVRRLPEWLQRHSRFARNASPDCCEGPQPAESKKFIKVPHPWSTAHGAFSEIRVK